MRFGPLFALALVACAGSSSTRLEAGRQTTGAAIHAAAGYLHRHLDPRGRFVYKINLDGLPFDKKKYNVLRHAGTIYSLGQYQRFAPAAKNRAAILRAATYLRRHHLKRVKGRPGLMAIFSRHGEEVRDGHRVAKLGGSALGLVALLVARELAPKRFPLEELRAVGRFILFMQMGNGRFRARYDEVTRFGRDRVSLYYPGEAILALSRLYRADPDRLWLEGAARAAAWLVRSRQGVTRLPNDHWLMIASRALEPHWPTLVKPPIPWGELVDHVIELGREMLREQRDVAVRRPWLVGSFSPFGHTTPAATRLEGLIALHAVLRGTHAALRKTLRASIADGIGFIRRCQVSRGRGKGGFVWALRKLRGRGKALEFNRRQAEVRIDYVQHAMSALIGYHALARAAR